MPNIASNPSATTVAFTAPRQLSDQNSQGSELGASATDLIGFYGATPVAQQSAGMNAVFNTASLDNGTLTKYQVTASVASVAATTTLETTSTVTGLSVGEVIAVNKPAAQAGLGIAGIAYLLQTRWALTIPTSVQALSPRPRQMRMT